MRIYAFSVMPSRWYLLLWPERDGELVRFMHWLTIAHASRTKRRPAGELESLRRSVHRGRPFGAAEWQ